MPAEFCIRLDFRTSVNCLKPPYRRSQDFVETIDRPTARPTEEQDDRYRRADLADVRNTVRCVPQKRVDFREPSCPLFKLCGPISSTIIPPRGEGPCFHVIAPLLVSNFDWNGDRTARSTIRRAIHCPISVCQSTAVPPVWRERGDFPSYANVRPR